jgi:hypothetical protein
MLERIIMLLDKFVTYMIGLMGTPVVYLMPIDILMIAAMGIGIYFFVKYSVKAFFRYGMIGLSTAYRPIKRSYAKYIRYCRNKRICPVCRNPLHDCVCRGNKNLSYSKRLKNWKKKQSNLIKANKQKNKELRNLNKPIELKKKKNGGR